MSLQTPRYKVEFWDMSGCTGIIEVEKLEDAPTWLDWSRVRSITERRSMTREEVLRYYPDLEGRINELSEMR